MQTPMLNARQFAPQLAVFQNTHLGSAIMQANEFAIKERHLRPDCPMPLLKPAGDGTVTVIYFVEIPPAAPSVEDLAQASDDYSLRSYPSIRTRFPGAGEMPDTARGWWPERFKNP